MKDGEKEDVVVEVGGDWIASAVAVVGDGVVVVLVLAS